MASERNVARLTNAWNGCERKMKSVLRLFEGAGGRGVEVRNYSVTGKSLSNKHMVAVLTSIQAYIYWRVRKHRQIHKHADAHTQPNKTLKNKNSIQEQKQAHIHSPSQATQHFWCHFHPRILQTQATSQVFRQMGCGRG